MTSTSKKKKFFSAVLIKYKDTHAGENDYIWFWINPNSKAPLSPHFLTQKDAEKWFDDVLDVHQETYDLLERIQYGKFYIVKGRVDVGDMISSMKANECSFTMHLEDDVLQVEVLANSVEHARKRVEEYFEILEWMD